MPRMRAIFLVSEAYSHSQEAAVGYLPASPQRCNAQIKEKTSNSVRNPLQPFRDEHCNRTKDCHEEC